MPIGAPPRQIAMIIVGTKPLEKTLSASRNESTNNWFAERYCLSLIVPKKSPKVIRLMAGLCALSQKDIIVKKRVIKKAALPQEAYEMANRATPIISGPTK